MKFQKLAVLLFLLLVGYTSSTAAQSIHGHPPFEPQQLQETGPGDNYRLPFDGRDLNQGGLIGVGPHVGRNITDLQVPPGFRVTLIADGLDRPKGIDSALNNAGGGPMGDDLVVAESGQNRLVRVSKVGLGVTHFANTLGIFPVGVACYGGPFAQFVYVGNSMGSGVEKIDVDGNCTLFSAPGLGIAGLDFGRGPFGNFLYAGEWAMGTIWCINCDGAMTSFASIPGGQSRYLKFSRGGQFGDFLYVTDFTDGEIWRVDHTGTAIWFTTTGTPGLEGLAFSPGGAFGKYLYTGNLLNGKLYQVAPDGSVQVFASGFPGVADLIFEPGIGGGFTMYLVDGVSAVFAISKV